MMLLTQIWHLFYTKLYVICRQCCTKNVSVNIYILHKIISCKLCLVPSRYNLISVLCFNGSFVFQNRNIWFCTLKHNSVLLLIHGLVKINKYCQRCLSVILKTLKQFRWLNVDLTFIFNQISTNQHWVLKIERV